MIVKGCQVLEPGSKRRFVLSYKYGVPQVPAQEKIYCEVVGGKYCGNP